MWPRLMKRRGCATVARAGAGQFTPFPAVSRVSKRVVPRPLQHPLPQTHAGAALHCCDGHGVAALAAETGAYADLFELTSLKTFIAGFAGHIAAEAAR